MKTVFEFIAFLAILSLLMLLAPRLNADARFPAKYRPVLVEECLKLDVPVGLAYHLAVSESSLNVNARNYNKKGTKYETVDVGYFQLNSSCTEYFTWKFFPGSTFDPAKPSDNIRCGVRYLAFLKGVFGNWEDAITAYKGGPTRLLAGKDIPKARAVAETVIFNYLSDMHLSSAKPWKYVDTL